MSTTENELAEFNGLRNMLGTMRKRLTALVPSHMTSGRLCASVLGAVDRIPALLKCRPESMQLAVVRVAYMGWEVDGPHAKAHLIPYGSDVVVVPDFRGVVDVMLRSGVVLDVTARMVYSEDEFALEYGTGERIRHIPMITGDRGHPVGVYAVATLAGAVKKFDFMRSDEVDRIRAASPAGNKEEGPWKKHPDEMAKKTVIKRLAKTCPFSAEDLRGIEGAIAVPDEPESLKNTATVVDVQPSQGEQAGEPVQEQKAPPVNERKQLVTRLSVLSLEMPKAYAQAIREGGGLEPVAMTLEDLRNTIAHLENLEESEASTAGKGN